MRVYTVTLAGRERYDGESPWTYVVTGSHIEDAVEFAKVYHRTLHEDEKLLLMEVFEGEPSADCGYSWNDLRIGGARRGSKHVMDLRDSLSLARKLALFDRESRPRDGDWVIFADGITRRISHIWRFDDEPWAIQTSDYGSFYLGSGYCSFSGSLYNSVSAETLRHTDEVRQGSAWFFHHDLPGAGDGVEFTVPFRVFGSSVAAPKV